MECKHTIAVTHTTSHNDLHSSVYLHGVRAEAGVAHDGGALRAPAGDIHRGIHARVVRQRVVLRAKRDAVGAEAGVECEGRQQRLVREAGGAVPRRDGLAWDQPRFKDAWVARVLHARLARGLAPRRQAGQGGERRLQRRAAVRLLRERRRGGGGGGVSGGADGATAAGEAGPAAGWCATR